jgi:ParB family transcriptional regulator, chromosome partitioning protein
VASSKKKALGRGLGALIGGAEPEAAPVVADAGVVAKGAPASTVVETVAPEARIQELKARELEPNPYQPRRVFNEDTLQELADSIRQDGVQEPVIVRQVDGRYELVSGERRVRASIMAGLETVPAICREISDDDMLRLGLIENIQREDLNAIEQAQAYDQLIAAFAWTQEELARQVGKKRATVTNTLRLLNLPGDVQDAVGRGEISMGHARALLALTSPDAQGAACRRIIREGLSVRQVERLVEPKQPKTRRSSVKKDPNLAALEDDLRRRFGTRVLVRATAEKKGRIEIEYYSLEDLERLLALLRG